VVQIDPLPEAEEKAENPVGEFTVQMALAEAREKYRDEAQTILRNKQAATQFLA
jgi:hypothetical protein